MTDDRHQHLAALAAPFSPLLPIPELIQRLNRIYHEHEAAVYDSQHPEIREQVPPAWRRLVGRLGNPPAGGWSVLDAGCGTGFASQQLLGLIGPAQVQRLVCYDPSPAMVERCRINLEGRHPAPVCTSVLPTGGGFDLLITNAVLHHLPAPEDLLDGLEPLLTADAWWINGHEPSSRFWRNPACARHYREWQAAHRIRRFFEPHRYLNRLKTLLIGDMRKAVCRRAREEGLFSRVPTPEAVEHLVDCGVAHDPSDAEAGRGIDPLALAGRWQGRWRLEDWTSYGFLGDQWEGAQTTGWRRRCQALGKLHPDDGASYCALWRRG